MWDEIIKIKPNKFNLARNSGELFYFIVDENYDVVIDKKVKRWYNNGFILCEEHIEDYYAAKDHDVFEEYFLYTILNNNLEEIYTIKIKNKDYTFLTDFKYGCLPLLSPSGLYYGAIDEFGNEIIKFIHILKEVYIRIDIIGYYKGLTKGKENEVTRAIMLFRYSDLENTSEIDDFLTNLFSNYQDIHEILFHLILIKDLGKRKYIIEYNKTYYNKLQHIIWNFDIYFILEYIKEKAGIPINYILFNNSPYNSKYYEEFILEYYPLNEDDFINCQKNIDKRKDHLWELCDKISFLKFERTKFNIIEKENMERIKSASPYVKGRKVLIDEYLTIENNFTEKKYVGDRFFGIYKQPADFLNQKIYKNLHVISDVSNSDIYYIAEAKSIKLCLLDFKCTYDDYYELLM